MFGNDTKALGHHSIESARIALKCAQHDYFITSQQGKEELIRLDATNRRMVTSLVEKFDYRVSFDTKGTTRDIKE